MKRRLLLLALPLILAALVLGVKWRADHPTPTKEDLEIRALMKKPRSAYVSYGIPYRINNRNNKFTGFSLSVFGKELKPLSDTLFLLPPRPLTPHSASASGSFYITLYFNNPKQGAIRRIFFVWDVNGRGKCVVSNSKWQKEYPLHRVSVKRWTELLLANPRIGLELRKQMNPQLQ